MVSPLRRREALELVEDRLEVSVSAVPAPQSRSALLHATLPAMLPRVGRAASGAAIRRWDRAEPRWGCRMAAGKLREEGWVVNFKRVHHLWKQAGLRVLTKARNRRSLGSRKHGASRLKAERHKHVWSYDFIFDQTSDGCRLNWLPLVHEFIKEHLALEVDRRLEPADVIAVLDKAVQQYGVLRVYQLRQQSGVHRQKGPLLDPK